MMTVNSAVGAIRGDDLLRAAQQAAAEARARLGGAAPQAALLLTTGRVSSDVLVPSLREIIGAVPMAGGAVVGILTTEGPIESGAAVMCFTAERLSASIGCGDTAADLLTATERAGRLILAGSVSRRRYPRGVALAFTPSGGQSLIPDFLVPWRNVMGPKLRNIVSAVSGDAIYASGTRGPGRLAVLCLEGHYQSGLGLAPGYVPDDTALTMETLVHGAADAAGTAVKRLEGQPVRGVMIAESAFRQATLGPLAAEEWTAMRDQIGPDVPILGWLTAAECGCGHGTMPTGDSGSVVVAAIGDALDIPGPDRAP